MKKIIFAALFSALLGVTYSIKSDAKTPAVTDTADTSIPVRLQAYKKDQDWKGFSKLINQLIAQYPPKTHGTQFSDAVQYSPYGGDTWNLNCLAWDFFLKCSDKALLKSALKWSELSITLGAGEKGGDNGQYLDTEANILYRLGKTKEAIGLEEETAKQFTAATQKPCDSCLETIAKMKKGEPTW